MKPIDWRLVWLAVGALALALAFTGCKRVTIPAAIDGMHKAVRAGAIVVDQADSVIEAGTDIRIAVCSDQQTEERRTACMGKLDADNQERIANLLRAIGTLYDEAAKSLPKLERMLLELRDYVEAARKAKQK